MLEDLKAELDALAIQGRAKSLHVGHSESPPVIDYRGRKLINFASWDFFNLNRDRKFQRAMQTQIESGGYGACSPRLSAGTVFPHLKAEADLARFMSSESAVLFSSRNQAVLSLITALLNERDVLLVDDLVQSPASDATYLVNANCLNYKFGDLNSLRQELEKTREFKKKVLFLESVSCLSGALVPLLEMLTLARSYDCEVIVDESYGLGWLGLRGAGISELHSIQKGLLACVGDLSFGFGLGGAFVSGSGILVSYLINRSRTFQSESAPSPVLASGISAGIHHIELLHGARERLGELSEILRRALCDLGLQTTSAEKGPIVCAVAGKLRRALELGEALHNKGFLVDALPLGSPLSDLGVIRLIVTTAHTEEHISELGSVLTEILPKLGKN